MGVWLSTTGINREAVRNDHFRKVAVQCCRSRFPPQAEHHQVTNRKALTEQRIPKLPQPMDWIAWGYRLAKNQSRSYFFLLRDFLAGTSGSGDSDLTLFFDFFSLIFLESVSSSFAGLSDFAGLSPFSGLSPLSGLSGFTFLAFGGAPFASEEGGALMFLSWGVSQLSLDHWNWTNNWTLQAIYYRPISKLRNLERVM